MRIDKIDPPSWFVGMTDHKLLLFIYGEGLKGVSVTLEFGRVVRIVSDNFYAIIEIEQNSEEGCYNILFEKDGNRISKDYVLKRKCNCSYSPITPADSVYLVMPDRFAKGGDITYKGKLTPENPYGWHGGNINGIIEHLNYIVDLGVTAIWLTPIFKNNKSIYKRRYSSYHGYAITDYYDVDEHFGTLEDYKRLVNEAHKKGLKVVMDVVFNHCGSEHPWNNSASPRSWINRNKTKTNYECTTIFGSHVSQYDRELTTKGWFAETMPDLNLSNKDVLKYLTQMTFWWIEIAGIDAIRMDTYLYSDNRQMNKWLKYLRRDFPEFSVIAETWIGNPAYTATIQKKALRYTGSSSPLIVMDFAFQEKILEAVRKHDFKIIYNHFIYDFLYPNANQILAFIDNHDMVRWARRCPDIADMKIALTILLTMPRIPQIFYGTELMFQGAGNGKGDGNIREDFKVGLDGEILRYTRKLLHLRKECSAITSGDMVHFLPQNGVYVYFRKYNDEIIMIVVNPTNRDCEINMNRYKEVIYNIIKCDNMINGNEEYLNPSVMIRNKSVLILKLYNDGK